MSRRTLSFLSAPPAIRPPLAIALVWAALIVSPHPVSGQNSIGDALGQLITPAIGPVLERAADEAIQEGIRRGYERGRFLPRPNRRRPSPQPTPQPSPRPTPYPVQPTPVPIVSPERIVDPPTEPRAEPPRNAIPTRPAVSPNAPPIESVMTHAVSTGPALATKVIATEAEQIRDELDRAVLRYSDASLNGASAAEFSAAYRRLIASAEPETSRVELWNSISDRIAADDASQLNSVLKVIDASDRLASDASEVSHEQVMQSISDLRSLLVGYRGNLLSGQQTAVLAERIKNLRNFAVLGELVRVLGVQRRNDLLPQFAAAAYKSRLPDEAVSTLLGIPMGHSEDSIADMQLPGGTASVVVFNPPDSPGDIAFVCDDQLEIKLAPGELAPFGQEFVVRFDDGQGRTNRYTLSPGLYRWVIDQQRWDIRRKTTIRLTIDASHSPAAFHYLINGEPISIAPGQALEHELTQPPRVDFDLGVGDGSIKSSLLTPGHYIVGVNPETSGWDIYRVPGDGGPQSGSVSELATEHLRKSILQTRYAASQNAADARVTDLLNAIE